ncbi:cAMP-dependent protein kinase catalytic subunit 3 [Phlebotomus argentipes]|uniref:cAMP-dependent protein kinase catalytic subunit 3 n=1 Tax=Phlebotomus argentipes TaxID=94469 RepID=UPI0028937E8A|nr:cAMP-dependent protein kinase catalytic subunit 3 [Phlebotomus argentipes]
MRGRSRSQSLSETSSCSSAAASDLGHKLSSAAVISDDVESDEEESSSESAKVNGKMSQRNDTASSTTQEEDSDPVESDFSEADAEEIEDEETSAEEEVEEEPEEVEYTLDDFQMIKTIGTGTFGRVCLCRDKTDNSYCAMKILAMCDVIRLKQVEHVKNEKNILAEIHHPFVVNLKWYTKDNTSLYMLFEYVCGGELFTYLRNAGKFNNSTANFYACEIVMALEYLHSLSIVYRDLKPENLLLDRDGHLKITDFGFAKKLKDRTWTLCGTPEYLAPEILQSKGHNKAVDWWALGVLIYEMLVGYPPFYDDNPLGIYEKILSGKVEWPRQMDAVAKDLVKKLLVLDRTKRMGNMKNGSDDVKRHRWFKHLDWTDVYNRKLKPPIVPQVRFDGDTSNFDEYPEADAKKTRLPSSAERKLFDDF